MVFNKYEWSIIIEYYTKYVKKFNSLYILLLVVLLLSKTLSLAIPYLNGKIIDFVLSKESSHVLNNLIMVFLIIIVNGILNLIGSYVQNHIKGKTLLEIRKGIFETILSYKYSDYKKQDTGEYISKIEGDSTVVADFYINNAVSILVHIITLCIAGYFIVKISLPMSIMALMLYPIVFIVNRTYGEKIKNSQSAFRIVSDKYLKTLQEFLSNIIELKIFTLENYASEKFHRCLDETKRNGIKSSNAMSLGGFVIMLCSSFVEISLTGLGCYKMIKGTLSIGEYVAFMAYLSYVIGSIRGMASVNLNVQTAIVSMKRISELQTTDSEDFTNGICDIEFNAGIHIQNVCFSYNSDGNRVLNDVCIDARPHSITAIVGMNGSGKSTLMDLIVRVNEFQSGNILIGDTSVKNINLKYLRENIAYIRQTPLFFNDTIKNNLLLAKENANFEDIENACKDVMLKDFIESLPNKYDTIIGEHGERLSGGQRQRLAIARGLLKGSKFFLLDEVTSNLDKEAECNFSSLLRKLSSDHTVILVSHRLSSIRNADHITVIHDGRIEGSGNHETLMQECTHYKNMVLHDME